MNISDVLSIAAIIVAIGTFIWIEIKEWLKRPRLNIFLRIITYVDEKAQAEEDMLTILMINDGYSPIIISQCIYKTTDGGEGNIGIYDELKAPYGVHDIVLPEMIKPAESFTLNFLRAADLEKITEITLIDAYNKKYLIPQEQIAKAVENFRKQVNLRRSK